MRRIRRSFELIGWDRVCELRYEDLVREPEKTLQRVCGFLGEEFAPAMLDYDTENRTRQLEPAEFDAWKRRNREGLDVSAIDRWERELTAREASLAQLTAGAMLRRYHYPASGAAGPGVLVAYALAYARYRARRLTRRLRRLATRAASSCV
jgi:hypothetical protein